MNKTQSEIHPRREPTTPRGRRTLQTAFKVMATTILIASLGIAGFLPFMRYEARPAMAAPLEGVPTDVVTLVNSVETSQFQTPDDPTDDSIEYWPDTDWTGTDTFYYEICDGVSACDQAMVTVEVTATTVLAGDAPQTLAGEAVDAPSVVNDSESILVNTWVNVDVLANDDFGTGGPGTGPIRIGEDCGDPGPDVNDCALPENGTARVNEGPRSPDPMGLAFLDGHTNSNYTDHLLISDSEVNEIYPPNEAAFTGDNLFLTDLSGNLTQTLTTLFDEGPPAFYSDEPTGVAYNPVNRHLYFTDDNRNRIWEIDPGGDNDYSTVNPSHVREFRTSLIGSLDPSGITYDSWHDDLIFVDEGQSEVYIIDLGPNGMLDLADTWTNFDVESIGIDAPEGIEFNPDNGNLYILSSTFTNLIAETTIDGKLLRYLDVSGVPNFKAMSGLAYIPQANGSTTNTLYIVARGVDNNPPVLGGTTLLGDPLENDGMMVEVSFPRNAPPYVNAGPDQATALPDNVNPAVVNLDGTVLDDGFPESATMTTTWSIVSGPGIVTFGDDSQVDTTASFPSVGVYTLQLEADDGGLHLVSDEVVITVGPPGNQPPVVDAGPPQIVTLPAGAILDGTVTDDGLPNPPGVVTTDWVKVSGQGLVTFGDPSAVDTTASFSAPGVYVLRLSAFDGALTSTDEVTISVNPSLLQRIWLPLVLKNP